MAVYKSRGIVLRSIRYGEADRILDLYTPDGGLVSTIAKGIRRTRSRFGGRLELLCCVEFMAYRGRTLHTLTQAEVLRSFHSIRESLPRLETAGAMVRAVRALSGGGEADRRVFNLLFHALDALELRSSDFGILQAAFGLKLSILAGYSPQLDSCPVCELEIQEPERGDPLRFSPVLGGMIHGECSSADRDSFSVSPGTLPAMQDIKRLPIRDVSAGLRVERSAQRVVAAHIFSHAPGAPSERALTGTHAAVRRH